MNSKEKVAPMSTLTQYSQGKLIYKKLGSLLLESGFFLPNVTMAFELFGKPNAAQDNIILVEHALTGDAHASSCCDCPGASRPAWWDGIIGPGLPLDTEKYCILAINALGGCYGSSGPATLHPDGNPWGSRFPRLTIRDQVHAEHALARSLGIEFFAAAVGGSMGAARVLEWAMLYPECVKRALALAISAKASAYMIGTQQVQIEAIASDPYWRNGDYYDRRYVPEQGLRLARQIAHLTYRTAQELDHRFGNRRQRQTGADTPCGEDFAVASYLGYQADKLCRRFDPGSYVALTRALNTHDVGRGRAGVVSALENCSVPFVVAGIDSDCLFPLEEQAFLAKHLARCSDLRVISSAYGHDAFLLENEAVGAVISETLSL